MSYEIYKILSLEDLKGETWNDIPNYEGYYKISNFGRIKRLKREISCCYDSTKIIKDKIIKQEVTEKGYLRVSIFRNGKKEKRFVHVLVLKSFINNIENKKTVNHKNGVKIDNKVSNLEWATNSENCLHSYKNGFSKIKKGIESHRYGMKGSLSSISKPVIKMTKDFKFIKKYESMNLAAIDNNLNVQNISSVCKGIRNYCGQFTWKYA